MKSTSKCMGASTWSASAKRSSMASAAGASPWPPGMAEASARRRQEAGEHKFDPTSVSSERACTWRCWRCSAGWPVVMRDARCWLASRPPCRHTVKPAARGRPPSHQQAATAALIGSHQSNQQLVYLSFPTKSSNQSKQLAGGRREGGSLPVAWGRASAL